MHSRILVLDEQIPDVDRVFEEMSSYGNGVDYVTESESPYEEDYDWAMGYMTELGINATSDKTGFKIYDKSFFYEAMEQDIRDLLDDNGVQGLNRFKIEDRCGMKHDFWIWYDDNLYTLPYFMEFVENGKEFKIHGFLDYHF